MLFKIDNAKLCKYDHARRVFDKWLFFIAFIIGVSGMMISKLLGFSQLIITGWPILIMFSYFGYVQLVARARLRDDQTGDNLYYLGLLYTLTSLSMALYSFTSDSGSTAEIVSNFGIALATTITGLSLRILLMSMRQDEVEIEKEARVHLADAASSLRSEIDDAVLNFNSFRRATQQSTQEGIDEIAKQASKEIQSIVKQVSDKLENIFSEMDNSFKNYSKNARDLNNSSRQGIRAMKNLIEQINQMDISDNVIEEKLNPLKESLDYFSLHIQNIIEKNNQNSNQFDDVTNKIYQNLEKIELIYTKLDKSSNSVISTLNEVGKLQEDINKIHESFKSFVDSTSSDKDRLVQDTSIFHQKITDMYNEIDKQININKHFFNDLIKDIKQKYDYINQYNNKLEKELEKSSEMTLRVQNCLIEMVETIEKSIRHLSSNNYHLNEISSDSEVGY